MCTDSLKKELQPAIVPTKTKKLTIQIRKKIQSIY